MRVCSSSFALPFNGVSVPKISRVCFACMSRLALRVLRNGVTVVGTKTGVAAGT